MENDHETLTQLNKDYIRSVQAGDVHRFEDDPLPSTPFRRTFRPTLGVLPASVRVGESKPLEPVRIMPAQGSVKRQAFCSSSRFLDFT